MKLKMLETYQGVGDSATLLHEGVTVTILEEGESYEVNAKLATWLIENGKAQELTDELHYGAQTEAVLRDDEKIYEAMAKESAEEEVPVMTTENQATRRTKRGKK